ncbi:MAG: tyrosine-type recombinase/integrase [Phycisphaerae bacterium]|nr:tyrosine-type recombinase/integrase [Phycisphaerae bacterium]
MTTQLLVAKQDASNAALPVAVLQSGANARYAYEEFFAGLDSSHTARAYRHAVHRFLAVCDEIGTPINRVTPGFVGDYIKELQAESKAPDGQTPKLRPASKPTRKLHLAALRHFFDKLVQRHAIPLNPALSVRGPKHSVTEGKTAAMDPKQIRELLLSIRLVTSKGAPDIAGLRDRAAIATLVFTAARAGAVAKLRRQDFVSDGRQHYLRLDEKGGKVRTIPCRTDLQQHIEEYLAAIGTTDTNTPLFLSMVGRTRTMSGRGVTENDLLRMLKRRLTAAGLPAHAFKCHSLRASTATNLLEQGVELADVQFLLGHSDPRTTKLYDRRKMSVTRNIVERISI